MCIRDRFAAAQWRARGVSVFNLSPVSALSADIIERKDWQVLLKEESAMQKGA